MNQLFSKNAPLLHGLLVIGILSTPFKFANPDQSTIIVANKIVFAEINVLKNRV